MIDRQSWITSERTVAAGDCDLRVVERDGVEPALVLVHGLGASTVLWDAVAEQLPAGLRVVALDLRGAGRSRERGPGEPVALSPGLWAADLHAVLTELDVDEAVLVGHSLGATVAVEHALRWPDRVRGLVLIGIEARLSSLAPRMQRSADLIREVGLESWVHDHWERNPPFGPSSLEAAPELLDLYRAMLLANRPADYVRACEAIVAADDLTPRLGGVAVPAVVVVGEMDDRTLPAEGRRMAAEMPGARLVEVAGAGHTLPMEAPAAVAEAIVQLADLVAAAPEGQP